MSFSYAGDPSMSEIDECRFVLGDTDANEALFQDEEIEYLIDQSNGDKDRLYYLLFNQASIIYAKAIKRSLGPQSEDPTSRLNFFKSQAKMYEKRMSIKGLSLPTYSHPKIFRKGMHSNPPLRGGGRFV